MLSRLVLQCIQTIIPCGTKSTFKLKCLSYQFNIYIQIFSIITKKISPTRTIYVFLSTFLISSLRSQRGHCTESVDLDLFRPLNNRPLCTRTNHHWDSGPFRGSELIIKIARTVEKALCPPLSSKVIKIVPLNQEEK